MGAWISDDAHLRRREFIDYIYGLIRHEIHKGQDDDKRLEVLSKIYHDLIYVENLDQADGWQKKYKGKDELCLALDKIQKLTRELEEVKSHLDILLNIHNGMTKKDIIDLVERVKGGLGANV